MIDPNNLFDNVKFLANGHDCQVSCPSPIHSKNNNNGVFNYKDGSYICHSCKKSFAPGQSARLLMWVRQWRPTSFLSPMKKEPKKTNEIDWRRLNKYPLAIDHPYLVGRGVSNESVKEFQIRASENRIIFPLTSIRSGLTVGYQTRLLYKAPQRYILYGGRAPFGGIAYPKYNKDLLILNEGVFGMLRGYQYGFPTLAVLGSQGFKDSTPLVKFNRIYLAFDDDDGGYKIATRMKKKFPEKFFFIMQPGEYDELDQEEWTRRFEEATPYRFNKAELYWGKPYPQKFETLMKF